MEAGSGPVTTEGENVGLKQGQAELHYSLEQGQATPLDDREHGTIVYTAARGNLTIPPLPLPLQSASLQAAEALVLVGEIISPLGLEDKPLPSLLGFETLVPRNVVLLAPSDSS